MNSFLLYLVEASLVLVVLYAAYRLLLSKETFFSFNRFFLMAILLLSLLLPLVSFELAQSDNSFINQQSTELGKARNSYHMTFENWSEWPVASPDEQSSWWQQFWSQDWDAWRILMVSAILIYSLGFTYWLLKLSLGYVRVYRLKKKLATIEFDGLKVTEIPAHMAPFSFLNTVFIPRHIEDEKEYAQILAHEKTHIQQRHSIDLLFVQLVATFLWFNPVVWLLLKSLKQTHEYIADKNILQQGFPLVEYQSLLLRQLISNNSYGLVHNFNLSFIKKRIAMMSIKESGWAGRSKALIALCLILAIGLMTIQSNTLLGGPPAETSDAPKASAKEMKFYVDEIPLSRGLLFSKAKAYTGELKFAFDNNQEDIILVGLDLVSSGKVTMSASQRLQEGESFNISALLSKAKQDDYLVVDIIDGPADAVKLYNVPLFREGAGWKRAQASDMPPPLVTLFVNGTAVGPQKGISLTKVKESGFEAKLEYVLSEFVDFEVMLRQAGGVEVSLVRGDHMVRVMVDKEMKRENSYDLSQIMKAARIGDSIWIQFGKPDGIRFGTQFLVE